MSIHNEDLRGRLADRLKRGTVTSFGSVGSGRYESVHKQRGQHRSRHPIGKSRNRKVSSKQHPPHHIVHEDTKLKSTDVSNQKSPEMNRAEMFKQLMESKYGSDTTIQKNSEKHDKEEDTPQNKSHSDQSDNSLSEKSKNNFNFGISKERIKSMRNNVQDERLKNLRSSVKDTMRQYKSKINTPNHVIINNNDTASHGRLRSIIAERWAGGSSKRNTNRKLILTSSKKTRERILNINDEKNKSIQDKNDDETNENRRNKHSRVAKNSQDLIDHKTDNSTDNNDSATSPDAGVDASEFSHTISKPDSTSERKVSIDTKEVQLLSSENDTKSTNSKRQRNKSQQFEDFQRMKRITMNNQNNQNNNTFDKSHSTPTTRRNTRGRRPATVSRLDPKQSFHERRLRRTDQYRPSSPKSSLGNKNSTERSYDHVVFENENINNISGSSSLSLKDSSEMRTNQNLTHRRLKKNSTGSDFSSFGYYNPESDDDSYAVRFQN